MSRNYTKQPELFSVKEIERAKLRALRDEMVRERDDRARKALALRRAEEAEASWELYRAGVRRLR